ncbi:MAG: hypothetical protein JSS72_05720 [Armatimonadetes bacterium]|nr:hypothetical protein [Armatimonadota bacterium]
MQEFKIKLINDFKPWGQRLIDVVEAIAHPDEVYTEMQASEAARDRALRLVKFAPHLVSALGWRPSVLKSVVGGKRVSVDTVVNNFKALPISTSEPDLAEAFVSSHQFLQADWLLNAGFDLWVATSRLTEALIVHSIERLGLDFDVFALGELARLEVGPSMEIELMLLARADNQEVSEAEAMRLVRFFQALQQHGIELSARLIGLNGVVNEEALKEYDLMALPLPLRFALGQARLIAGRPLGEQVQRIGYAVPLTPDRLRELSQFKKHEENTHLQPPNELRNLYHGHGGLQDIEWLVHMHELRYPGATQAGTTLDMKERLRSLARSGFLNALELEVLLEGHDERLRLREYLAVLGVEKVPENPDKLALLAELWQVKDGNEFLKQHERSMETVRQIFLGTLDRFKA